jgi:hypothetical protein
MVLPEIYRGTPKKGIVGVSKIELIMIEIKLIGSKRVNDKIINKDYCLIF